MLAKKVPGALATLGASSVDLIRVRDEGCWRSVSELTGRMPRSLSVQLCDYVHLQLSGMKKKGGFPGNGKGRVSG